ncbi:MAG TPA: hypothetical protein VKI44_03580 [Acetobacteraceae bacterium]|nr:hypothetical protein [Acetobacteraceae bacterium]
MSQLQELLTAADRLMLAASHMQADEAQALNTEREAIDEQILNTIPENEADLRVLIAALRDAVDQEDRPKLVRQADFALAAAEGDLGTAMALADLVLESDCGPWSIGLASVLDVACCRLAGLC